ncbi:MAG: GNAT family protein [Sphaerochaeta sp.]|nr:GNAT family N-acetyltransferase [Sphaerochaeta sp.]MDD4301943.1 GNAT family protein [Sphaerochaeta sp.]MDD4647976.1 GNAT family protein [Sphaerochaeta sp.]
MVLNPAYTRFIKHVSTERLSLKPLSSSDGELLQNRTFFSPWEPLRKDAYYSKEAILQRIEEELLLARGGKQLSLYLTKPGRSEDHRECDLVRGPFQSSFLGYKLDEEETGKGYMAEAAARVTAIAFNELQLHRIEATIMPRNRKSIRVVEQNGFTYEGLSKYYLKIQGNWEDHAHYKMLHEEWKEHTREENIHLLG